MLFLKTFHYKKDKKCKSFSIFFLKKDNKIFFFYFKKFPRHKHAKWPPIDLTPWTLTLTLNEGHTLGNVLRSVIMQNPQVAFCGYSLPHPAEDQMHLRIQTVEGKVIYQWVLTTVWVRLSKLLGLLLTNSFSNNFFLYFNL